MGGADDIKETGAVVGLPRIRVVPARDMPGAQGRR